MREPAIAVRGGLDGKLDLFILTAEYVEDEHNWIATALEIGVSTYADTLKEARNELMDAVMMQLNEVERLGFMDEYLAEQGIRIQSLSIGDMVKSGSHPQEQWALAAAV